MKLRSKILWVAISVGGLLLLFGLLLHTSQARRYVLNTAASFLRDSQGIRLEATELDYNLLRLSVELKKVSLASVTAAELPPFLKAESVFVNLRLSGLLRGMLSVEEARLDELGVHIVQDAQGRTNLPQSQQPQQETSAPAPLPSVLVSSLQITRGSILVEDRAQDSGVHLPLWNLSITGDSRTLDHTVRFRTAEPGTAIFEGRDLPVSALEIDAAVKPPGTLELTGLRIASEDSQFRATGRLNDFAQPNVNLNATIDIDVANVTRFAGLTQPLGGRLRSEVSLGGPLDKLRASVKLDGADLSVRSLRRIDLAADVRMDVASRRVEISSLTVSSPAVALTAQANLALAPGAGASALNAGIQNLDLLEISRALDLPVQVASSLTGNIDAQWPGMAFEQVAGEVNLALSSRDARPAPNVLPVTASLSAKARGRQVQVEVASLEALGARWRGNVSLASYEALGGELTVEVPSLGSLIASAETFLDKPSGSLAGVSVDGGLHLDAALGGTLSKPEVSAVLQAPQMRAGTVEGVSLEVSASYSPVRVRLDDLSLAWLGQSLTAQGEIGLTGETPSLSAAARISQASLKTIVSGLGQDVPVDGTINLDATVVGPLDNIDATLSLAASGLEAYGETVGAMEAQARFANRRLDLTRFDLTKPVPQGSPGRLTAKATYELDARSYAFEIDGAGLAFTDLTLPEGAPVQGVLNLSATGAGNIDNPTLDLRVDLDDARFRDVLLGALNASARLENHQAALKLAAPLFNLASSASVQTQAPYSIEAEVVATETDLSRFGVNVAEDEPLQGNVSATIRGAGELDNWKKGRLAASIDNLSVTLRGQEIRNRAPMRFGYEDGGLRVQSASLIAGTSTLDIQGSLPISSEDAGGTLAVTGGLDVAGLLAFLPEKPDFSAEAKLNLNAAVRGSVEKPDPIVRLTMADGLFDQPGFRVAVTNIGLDLGYEDGAVVLHKLGASFGPASFSASGELPLGALPGELPAGLQSKEGPARFTLDLSDFELAAFESLPDAVSGTVGLHVEAEMPQVNDLATLRAKATFQQLQARIAEYEIKQDSPSTLTVQDGSLRVDRFVLTGPKTRLEASGSAEVMGDRAVSLRLSGDLDAEVLTLLAEDFKAAGPSRFEIALGGQLTAPQVSGFFEMNKGQATLRSPRLLAEGLDIRLGFTPDRLTIERFTGALNGGALKGSGSVEYAGTELKNINVRVSVDGAFFDFPEGLKTQVLADLGIRTRDELVVVGGKVTIRDGAYRDPLDLEGQLLAYVQSSRGVDLTEERNPFLSRLRWDIAVETENPIVVDNDLATLALSSNLRLVGSFYRPSLTGRISLDEGGKLYLRENEFLVERGVITFVSEARIEPQLDMLLKTRAGGEDIDLTLSGGPGNFSAGFTSPSDPSLSEPDIISLLVTGRRLEKVQGAALSVAGQQAASFVSGRVTGRLARGAEQTLGLSRVRIEPNLITAESDPGARLTLGQDITNFLRLIYSMNLADSSDQIYIAEYDLTRRFNARAIRQSDNSNRFEFRHDLRFGGAPDTGRPPSGPRDRAKLGSIVFQGQLGFPEKTLSEKLDLKPGDRYDFFQVQKGTDRLNKFYEKQGFLEARIRANRDAKDDKVDLALNIDSGPEVDFVFEGAEVSGRLKKRIRQIWKDGIFDAQRGEESGRALRGYLIDKSYLQAKVSYKITENGKKLVIFELQPGTRYKNVSLVFEGASGIPPSRLESVVKDADLNTELYTNPNKVTELLTGVYRQEGYLEARVRAPRYELNPDSQSGKVVIAVDEGPAFRVGKLEFLGNKALPDSRLRESMRLAAGGPYRPELLDAAISKLEEIFWGDGYNDVVVNYELRREPEAGLMDVAFRIAENKQSVVNEIDIEGTHETSKRFAQGQVTLDQGDVLDFSKTSQSRKNLYDTGAYSVVDLQTTPLEAPAPDIGDNTKPVALRLKLREVKPFDLRYGAFYDTDRGPGVILDFANRNSLGAARVIGVRTRYDSDLREFRSYLSQPLLRRFPLKTNAVGFVRREIFDTFITDRTGVSLQQETRFKDSVILSYGYRFERTDTFDKDPDSLFKIPPFNIAPLTASFTRETRDDFLDATRGSFISHALEYAPDTLGSDIRFVKYFGQYFKYVPLSKPVEIPFGEGLKRPRLIYAGAVRLGLAKGLGDQNLIRSERFFAGGGTTIRGFEQNRLGPVDFLGDPAGGDAVFITNNELRFPVFSIFDGVGFLDIGNVYTRISDFDPFDVRKSGGAGLRVRTPYFLIRLDYGFKLDRKPGESRGAFFFSIGQAF